MDRTRALREDEGAELDRWFSPSSYGMLFHAEDGRAWSMNPRDVEKWRSEGRAMNDFIAIGLFLASLVIAVLASRTFGFGLGASIGTGIGVGMAAVHAWPYYCLWYHYQQMRKLRQRIIATMVAKSPLPVEIAAPYRRTNIFRLLLQIWIGLIVLATMLSMHFPFIYFMPVELPFLILGVAWGLYYASKHVDLQQKL
jgi:hypothetical protein